jgi:hypothetical protein
VDWLRLRRHNCRRHKLANWRRQEALNWLLLKRQDCRRHNLANWWRPKPLDWLRLEHLLTHLHLLIDIKHLFCHRPLS